MNFFRLKWKRCSLYTQCTSIIRVYLPRRRSRSAQILFNEFQTKLLKQQRRSALAAGLNDSLGMNQIIFERTVSGAWPSSGESTPLGVKCKSLVYTIHVDAYTSIHVKLRWILNFSITLVKDSTSTLMCHVSSWILSQCQSVQHRR